MKSSLLRTFFEWALITSVLMSVLFFGWYWAKSHETSKELEKMAAADIAYRGNLQNNQEVMARLAAECQAYARTNADLARLLSPPPATAPATRPGGK